LIVFQLGFQLSYAAVGGILLFQKNINRAFHPGNVIFKKAWELSSVSIAAQLGTIPIVLRYFHFFPNYFLFTNLLVIPLSGFIIYNALAVLAFSFMPGLMVILIKILSVQLSVLKEYVGFVENLPASVSGPYNFSLFSLIFWYLALFAFCGLQNSLHSLKLKFLLICLLALSISFFQTRILHYGKHELIVYSLPSKEIAIDYVFHGRHDFYKSPNVHSNEIEFNITGYWYKNNFPYTEGDSIYSGSLLKGDVSLAAAVYFWFNELNILDLNSHPCSCQSLPDTIKADVIILGKGNIISWKGIVNKFSPDFLIINGPTYETKAIPSEYKSTKIHILSRKAFVLSFT